MSQAEYIAHRIAMFDELKKKHNEFVAAQPRVPIQITLPDGRVMDGKSWETTPLDIAKLIRKSLGNEAVISRVDGELWDLVRPFEKDATCEILTFEDEDGKQVFWHSSAHILGEACEQHWGCHLCLGPPLEDGFYYEMGMEGSASQADYPALEKLASKAIKEAQPFERLLMTKGELLEMFKHNKYKQRFINDKVPDGTSSTVYRCGPLIDLCRGPHVPHTGRIKAFKVTKNSSSYFLGDAKNDSLQRIYGISFPEAKQLKEWEQMMVEAAKRDHRKLGQEQELFFFHELSPGTAFWLPHGAKIYNTLIELQRNEYRKRGFQEVISPNMYNTKLWEISGHWQNYQENMFGFEVEKEKFALKPMNCPGHCLMFKHRDRSYRELPLRMADFGVLHRNEYSGALSGLTRVRRFQQDDAHIFCTMDQLAVEMDSCMDFINHIYGIFGFTFQMALSTRPEKYLGELETWNKAEAILADALTKFTGDRKKWSINEADGAFYGPKIDITIQDALKRKFQCATVQLDFQLPERFGLEYQSNDPANPLQRPVMIHRAILGSVERCTAILMEHFGGKWPFWLSPRQAIVIPVVPAFNAYAEKVAKRFFDAGFEVEADVSDQTMQKKVRNAELGQFNFMFVVGEKEQEGDAVNVRNRDQDQKDKGRGTMVPVDEMIAVFKVLKETKAKSSVGSELTAPSVANKAKASA
ncbi:threonyl-tRNA synthetase [Cladochytrium replicatum]|nr:threonyl-tRNA synthetase [Cladochytrium replicatum]